MKRAKHTLSHYRMVTAGMGQLTPIACVPVLPGDTFQHSTSVLIRVTPLNTPVMHPVRVRVHHWFVPNRIVWPETENGGWEQFITGGPDGNNTEKPPVVTHDGEKKSMLSYLGCPPISGVQYNALALRALNLIINQRYRDQDLAAIRAVDDQGEFNVAWEKDYYTTARPWAQKGPQVSLPVGGQAPIRGIGLVQGQTMPVTSTNVTESDGSTQSYSRASISANIANHMAFRGEATAGNRPNITADLGAAAQININDFRAGFALQRYQEARSRYGSRFTEYLRYCGVTPSDARLQEPEYLGGGVARLNFSEVLQTTPSANPGTTPGVGDLYGHGIAGVRSNAYRKFFEEHGYVITLLSCRPKALYQNAVDREFFKETKEDYFQKELANLGQQEVYDRELYASNTQTVFGYQDNYDEYRRHPSNVGQDFRDLLNSWHMARELTAGTVLNEDFIRCRPTKRIYQVESTDPLWIMANHRIVARRMVPKRANPRII